MQLWFVFMYLMARQSHIVVITEPLWKYVCVC